MSKPINRVFGGTAGDVVHYLRVRQNRPLPAFDLTAPRGIMFARSLFVVCIAAWATVSLGQDYHTAEAPLPPTEAARSMVVPDGFQVTLYAGEPDVKQPIAFCIDDRGRLWVAEAYNYPLHGTGTGDRILIFEDTDGDGRFDNRTVFYDKLNYVSGIEVGFGGAWVISPPWFYFIPDRDGDDRPDDEPQVLLDGFGNHANAHNIANGLAWGPDGWLYGTHGRTNWSLLGKPGTAEAERVRFDGGVYRYHPLRHQWEPFADGTTNPWGIDFDDYGEAFICNCVNPHLYHAVQGAHFEPWRDRQSSQYAYERISSIADHLHFAGGGNVRAGINTAEELAMGGGHAHCGTMVYLGDNWPAEYRNTVFMNNIHGRRINNDTLRRAGSGYTASHAPDVMISRDPWFMGVTLAYGPDGGVFASDWSDTGECHSTQNTRRQTGRIYKITYGDTSAWRGDLAKLDDAELVQLQLHPNDWHVRHARRLLQERAASGADMTEVRRALFSMFAEHGDVTRMLRALWALHAIDALDDGFLTEQLNHESEYIRGWAIRLLCEDRDPPESALTRFQKMAANGTSPFVRLQLASALQRLSMEARWPIAAALAARADDAADANLPLMIWYGVEPLVADTKRYVDLAAAARIPLVRRHMARRLAEYDSGPQNLEFVARTLESSTDEVRDDLLEGLLTGLRGRRRAEMPASWPAVYAVLRTSGSASVREQAQRLALIFDDPAALFALRKAAANRSEPAADRRQAIEALVARKPRELAPLLTELLDDPATAGAALRGLAEYDEPNTATAILDRYDSFAPAVKQDAVQTLASRRAWADKLMDALEAGRVQRADVTAYTARQVRSLGDGRLIERLRQLWGEVRATPEENARLIADYKRRLTPDRLARADRASGRELFQKNCANCHRLFGAGGQIGPDITGSQRANLDYMLETLIDPSAAVARDWQIEQIETTDGRVITGLVMAEDPRSVTIQTVNEKLTLPSDEIAARVQSPLSMMPEGLLTPLSFAEVRDLLGYLATAGPVEGE